MRIYPQRFYGTEECTWYVDLRGRPWLVQDTSGQMSDFVAIISGGPDDASLLHGALDPRIVDEGLHALAEKLDELDIGREGCLTARELGLE